MTNILVDNKVNITRYFLKHWSLVISWIVPSRFFQPSLIFVCKARPYPSETLFRCSTQRLAPSLTKNVSLNWSIIILSFSRGDWIRTIKLKLKSRVLYHRAVYCHMLPQLLYFVTLSTCSSWGQCYNTFYSRNLQIFIMS